jgi:hypothetical protein
VSDWQYSDFNKVPPLAAPGDPSLVWLTENLTSGRAAPVVVYRDQDGNIQALTPAPTFTDVKDDPGPGPLGNATGLGDDPSYIVIYDTGRAFWLVSYRYQEHLYQVYWWREQNGNTSSGWQAFIPISPGRDKPKSTVPPVVAGSLTAYSERDQVLTTLYRDPDGGINAVVQKRDEVLRLANWPHESLTTVAKAPAAAGGPTGYVDAAGIQHVLYHDSEGRLHQLRKKPGFGWEHQPVTTAGAAPVPAAAQGRPTGFVDQGNEHVLYRGRDGHIHQLLRTGEAPWQHEDLTTAARAPLPGLGNPIGYAAPDGPQVFYRGSDRRIYRLSHRPKGKVQWFIRPLTPKAKGSALAAGVPTWGWDFGGKEYRLMFYRGRDGRTYQQRISA